MLKSGGINVRIAVQPNPLREHFDSQTTALGGWLNMPSPIGAEIMASLGLDYVVVDMQHGLIDYSDSLTLLASITGHPVTAVVRVPWNAPDHIGKALDGGAMGLIIPMVNSEAECRQAVGSATYPPQGRRSYGPTRASVVEGPEYFDEAEVAVMPMIETAEALGNLDAILAVEGISAVYVGPADLAISMGFQPGSEEPGFLEALDLIVERTNAHDVVPGIHATSATASDRIARGFRMVTVTTDIVALRTKLADDVNLVRAGLATKPTASFDR